MNVTASVLLFVIAAVCFVIATIIALSVINGGNFNAWVAGGLVAFALAHLPWRR